MGALALVPVLAIQERIAQGAEAVKVSESLTADVDGIEEGAPTVEADSEDSGLLRLQRREFVADPADPFKNDVLGREPQVKAFCAVLTGVEAPAVMSLDAGWGTGKTAFVKMCSAWMRSGAFPIFRHGRCELQRLDAGLYRRASQGHRGSGHEPDHRRRR